jgi:hypothetical protein
MVYKEDMSAEMLRLAQSLQQQTREGKINWSTTDLETGFLFSSTRSGVLIVKTSSGYRLQLLNYAGMTIGTLETGGGRSPELSEIDRGRNELLESLYYSARSNALAIKNTLDDMFGALGLETGPEPEEKPLSCRLRRQDLRRAERSRSGSVSEIKEQKSSRCRGWSRP